MSDDHAHHHRESSRQRLAWTLGLVLLYMVAEVVGGILTGSLALLADAGHMLSDAGSLALAIFAFWIAAKPRTPQRTFGYHRTEILAALANGVTLVVISIFILVEAWERLQAPQEVAGKTMMWIATGGLVINLIGARLLWDAKDSSLNLRGAWLHVVADTLGSFQALVAGALIWAFGWNIADPIASVLIALLVGWSSWTLLRDSVLVLMEGAPKHLDTEQIQRALEDVDGVIDVHDLHVWTITSGFDALSAHVRHDDEHGNEIQAAIRRVLHDRFEIEHTTIQLEIGDGCNHGCDET